MDISRMKQLRVNKKLRQKDVAEKLGFTQQRYNFYETGRNEPDNDTLILLSDFFDVSTDYLLGKTDDPTPPGEKEKTSPASELDEREALREALIKAGIIPADRDLTEDEARVLFGAAKGVFESFQK